MYWGHHLVRWDVPICVQGHGESRKIEGVDGDEVCGFGQFGREEILEKDIEVNSKDGNEGGWIQSSRETSRAHLYRFLYQTNRIATHLIEITTKLE